MSWDMLGENYASAIENNARKGQEMAGLAHHHLGWQL
jgi:hypothetical protein